MSNKVEIQNEIEKLKFVRQENNILHNSYWREKRELECIRSGNLEGIENCIKEPFGGKPGRLSQNSLRSEKNVAICAMAIYTRAAIDGGILPEEAFAAGDSWAILIDEAENIEEIKLYACEMARFFTKMVLDKRLITEVSTVNKLVEQCKDIIFKHMHEKITVQYIAKLLFVNPDYLSNLFHKEEGITITRYILKEKIERAKNLLMYSPYDCKSIGNYLGFSTQSHFGRVFKEYTKLTLLEYRKKYGKEVNPNWF